MAILKKKKETVKKDSADVTQEEDQKDDPQSRRKAALLEKQKKRKLIKRIVLGVLGVLAVFIWYGLQPLTAGMNYGICRTYIEGILTYPETFKITQYDEYGPSIRIFYTYTDAFGGQRSDMVECIIGPDPVAGYKASKISINRKPISDDELARFNMTIPGIVLGQPSLIIPRPADKDDLEALKRD